MTDSDERFRDSQEGSSFPSINQSEGEELDKNASHPANQSEPLGLSDSELLEELKEALREDSQYDPEVILKRITRRVSARVVSESTTGPLPPPSMVRGYEEVLPGAADRIFTLMERQSAHRQELERTALNRNSDSRDRGQKFAFSLCALVVVGGFIAIYLGHSVTGMASLLIAVGGIASTFLATRQRQQRELREKREALPDTQESHGSEGTQSEEAHT